MRSCSCCTAMSSEQCSLLCIRYVLESSTFDAEFCFPTDNNNRFRLEIIDEDEDTHHTVLIDFSSASGQPSLTRPQTFTCFPSGYPCGRCIWTSSELILRQIWNCEYPDSVGTEHWALAVMGEQTIASWIIFNVIIKTGHLSPTRRPVIRHSIGNMFAYFRLGEWMNEHSVLHPSQRYEKKRIANKMK